MGSDEEAGVGVAIEGAVNEGGELGEDDAFLGRGCVGGLRQGRCVSSSFGVGGDGDALLRWEVEVVAELLFGEAEEVGGVVFEVVDLGVGAVELGLEGGDVLIGGAAAVELGLVFEPGREDEARCQDGSADEDHGPEEQGFKPGGACHGEKG